MVRDVSYKAESQIHKTLYTVEASEARWSRFLTFINQVSESLMTSPRLPITALTLRL